MRDSVEASGSKLAHRFTRNCVAQKHGPWDLGDSNTTSLNPSKLHEQIEGPESWKNSFFNASFPGAAH